MDADQTIRTNAIETAMNLALKGTEATDTNSIIADANKIAAFVNDGTLPS